MNLFYENQGNNTYIVYRIQPGDELDSMGVGMITNNRIPGFAVASFTQMDADRFIKYNVSAKIPVSQLFSGPVNKKRLIGVFLGIVNAMISAEDYMISRQSILLNADYMFADVSTCATEVICLPLLNPSEEQVPLEMFFKNVLFTTQFDQTENCDHVAQLINYLNGNPRLSLEDFKNLLQGLAGNSVSSVSGGACVGSQTVTQQPAVTPAVDVKPAAEPVFQAKTATAIPESEQQKPSGNKIPDVSQLASQQMQIPDVKGAVVKNAQQSDKKEKKPSFLSGLFQSNTGKTKAHQGKKPASQGSTSACEIPNMNMGGVAIPTAQGQSSTGMVSHTQEQKQVQTQPRVQPQIQPQAQQASYVPTVQSTPLNFGETSVLGGEIGATTVLGASMPNVQMDPHLLRAKNNEKIPLNKPVFRIGKERSYVDYFVSDNTAISRSHANIVNHNGEFSVVDTNSTNHTYVNGTMLPSGQETRLAHGDKVRLANEDFEFRLY